MMDDEVAALVVDNGSGTVKIFLFYRFYGHFGAYFELLWVFLWLFWAELALK